MKGWRFVTFGTLLILGAGVGPSQAEAQFSEGQKYVGAHLGLSGVGSAPALGVSGEVAYNESIGIGAWFDTWSYGQTFGGVGAGKWNVRYVAIGGTGAWHFPVESNPKLDPFVGLGLGYFVVSTSWDGIGSSLSYDGSGSRVFLDGFAGLRYHFKENLSGVVRAGASVSYLTVGVDLKL